MSLLWIEGFETFGAVGNNIVALLVRKYGAPLDVSAGGCDLCAGRFFGAAARLRTTSPALCFSTPAFTPTATVIVGCAIKVDSISSPTDLLRFYDGDSLYHVGVQIVSSGIIRLNRAGTTLPGESAPNTVAAGQWYYLEIKVTVGDTNGSYEVRINGVTVASASGIDTRNGGTGLIDRVQFRGWQAGTASVFATYDDIYVLNTLAQRDWARWIFASLATYLKEVAEERDLPVLVEHLDERTEALMRATDRAEIRITGPFTQELSKGYWRVFVDANVLLTSRCDGDSKNAYSILAHAGAFHEAMDLPIGVWNFGGEPGDYVEDQPETHKFLGCLVPRPGQSVRVLNFGQIDPVEKIKQTEIEARYTMELSES